MRSPLKYFSLGILAFEKTHSLGSELFQYIDCQIPHGDLDPHFNVTGPHYVVGTCCRALRSLDTIPKYGIEHVNFNGLCDQYSYDSHCWSLVEDQFQSHFNYFHDLLDSTNGQSPSALNKNIEHVHQLLNQVCSNSDKTFEENVFSDDDFCVKTSRVRVKLARMFCLNRKYKTGLPAGGFCDTFNAEPYGQMCGLYQSCFRDEADGLCKSVAEVGEAEAQVQEEVIEEESSAPMGRSGPGSNFDWTEQDNSEELADFEEYSDEELEEQLKEYEAMSQDDTSNQTSDALESVSDSLEQLGQGLDQQMGDVDATLKQLTDMLKLDDQALDKVVDDNMSDKEISDMLEEKLDELLDSEEQVAKDLKETEKVVEDLIVSSELEPEGRSIVSEGTEDAPVLIQAIPNEIEDQEALGLDEAGLFTGDMDVSGFVGAASSSGYQPGEYADTNIQHEFQEDFEYEDEYETDGTSSYNYYAADGQTQSEDYVDHSINSDQDQNQDSVEFVDEGSPTDDDRVNFTNGPIVAKEFSEVQEQKESIEKTVDQSVSFHKGDSDMKSTFDEEDVRWVGGFGNVSKIDFYFLFYMKNCCP